MIDSGEAGIIMSYFLFMSIMLAVSPFFAPDLFNVQSSDFQEISPGIAEAGIFQVVISFINDLVLRFQVLFTISTSGTVIGSIVGIIIGAFTIGAAIVLSRLVAEALP